VLSAEDRARVSLLNDFYGPLLTERQRELVGLYYDQDLSLGEIAAQLGVSRQAVHDLLRRGRRALTDYEERLGLVARFERQRARLREMQRLLTAALREE
jgi:predicted DNA-binding protein YlxM (UPF0122 family)